MTFGRAVYPTLAALVATLAATTLRSKEGAAVRMTTPVDIPDREALVAATEPAAAAMDLAPAHAAEAAAAPRAVPLAAQHSDDGAASAAPHAVPVGSLGDHLGAVLALGGGGGGGELEVDYDALAAGGDSSSSSGSDDDGGDSDTDMGGGDIGLAGRGAAALVVFKINNDGWGATPAHAAASQRATTGTPLHSVNALARYESGVKR